MCVHAENRMDPFVLTTAICSNDHGCFFSLRVRTEDGIGFCAWVVLHEWCEILLIYASDLMWFA